jgi:hypothetical protein
VLNEGNEMEPPSNRYYMHLYTFFLFDFSLASSQWPPSLKNRGGDGGGDDVPSTTPTFQLSIRLFPCRAMLANGSMHPIERETTVLLEIKICDLDPQELQIMEEQAVRNVVEKIGESVLWGLEQELSLLRYDDWKGEYVRIEDGDEMVEEIDRQKGWDSKHSQYCAELIELNGDSRVGYVPSKFVWHSCG